MTEKLFNFVNCHAHRTAVSGTLVSDYRAPNLVADEFAAAGFGCGSFHEIKIVAVNLYLKRYKEPPIDR
jgi:hypothetical protein